MPNQSVRQAARRAALDAQARVRQRQEEREKRRSQLGVIIVTAIAERDERVRALELRAGQALHSLIEEEGLTAGEAAEWCSLPAKEVHRLRRALPAASGCAPKPPNPGGP